MIYRNNNMELIEIYNKNKIMKIYDLIKDFIIDEEIDELDFMNSVIYRKK